MVDDGGVRNVDATNISIAHAIAGHIYLAWPKREPTHSGPTAPATHPRHHRRRIHRTDMPGSGHPAPTIMPTRPTAVVKRRVSPRRIVPPGPSQWGNPGPMAIAIGSPIHGHRGRHPYSAVVRRVLPQAVFIKNNKTRDVLGHVLPRGRLVVLAVPLE